MAKCFRDRCSAGAWWRACRPKTLPAALVPVALGCVCAASEGAFSILPAACAAMFALLMQVTCNLANDYGDFVRGADTPDRVGPERAVAAGRISPGAMRRGTALAAVLAILAGLPLAAQCGWWLTGVGALSLAACLAYTGGPWPLAYAGLGDVFVLLFFGFAAVLFTTFVQCGAFPPQAWLAGLACGLLAVNILAVNNARDMETDARAGKRTLVVRLGRGFARYEYAAGFAVALLAPCALPALGFGPAALLPLLLAPWAFVLARKFWRVRSPADYNPLLARTAAFLMAYGVLFAAGLLAGGPR